MVERTDRPEPGGPYAELFDSCRERGWELRLALAHARPDLQPASAGETEPVPHERQSGKSLDRPGLRQALERIAAGSADGLIVAKLDRLSRSVIDFVLLLEWMSEADATLVALDLAIDTSTPSGRLMANVMASFAEWERDVIAARTRAGLASLRARGQPTGRPAVADRPELAARIRAMREEEGLTLQAIADTLNAEGVPTLRGAREWRVSSVQSAAGYQRRRPRRRAASLPSAKRSRS